MEDSRLDIVLQSISKFTRVINRDIEKNRLFSKRAFRAALQLGDEADEMQDMLDVQKSYVEDIKQAKLSVRVMGTKKEDVAAKDFIDLRKQMTNTTLTPGVKKRILALLEKAIARGCFLQEEKNEIRDLLHENMRLAILEMRTTRKIMKILTYFIEDVSRVIRELMRDAVPAEPQNS